MNALSDTQASLKSCKLPFLFDATRLQQDLARVRPDEWKAHYNKRDYEGDWEVAALRSPTGSPDNIYASVLLNIFKDTPLLTRCPYVQEVLAHLKCDKTSVRFMKLAPGSVIREHADSALSLADEDVRLHIPVSTNDHVTFMLDRKRLDLKEGECWYMDFTLLHSVSNAGTTPRVHLVVDCKLNAWLRALLLAPPQDFTVPDSPRQNIACILPDADAVS